MSRRARIYAGLIGLAGLVGAGLPAEAAGSGLSLPAPATRTFDQARALRPYALTIGPWQQGKMATLAVSGAVSVEAWRLPGKGGESGALMEMLARQLREAGFEPLFQCADDQCGGYDFRFAQEVVAEPLMHVDLGNFQYLAAQKQGEAGPEYVALLVSASPGAGFVQITRILPADAAASDIATDTVTSTMTDPTTADAPPPDAPVGAQLERKGHAVLSDLEFETGSSDLGPGPFASLAELASYLSDHPERRVALVGHSDAEGSLEVNVTLSKRRAASVRDRLIREYGLSPEQLTAEGVGFLSPLDSNLTEDGRSRNRRVEAVLISTR